MKRRNFITRLGGAALAALGVGATGKAAAKNMQAVETTQADVSDVSWWDGKEWRPVPSYTDEEFPEYAEAIRECEHAYTEFPVRN